MYCSTYFKAQALKSSKKFIRFSVYVELLNYLICEVDSKVSIRLAVD